MTCCPRFTKFFVFTLAIALAGVFYLNMSDRPTAADKQTKLLRHVVMFQFKDSSSKEDVQQVVDEFKALPGKVPAIAAFEYGTDNSPEGLADGFTHCFLLTFKSEADRESYLPHPAHQAFGKMLKPHLEKVLVVDYWAGE
ncbi:MAG: Dabb family protein [Aureliella sp.]